MRELTNDEMAAVSGGVGEVDSADSYQNALAASGIFIGGALAFMTAAPVIAGALAIGSIAASGVALWADYTDDEKAANQ
ncbi:MAG: bacteriocin [Pseudomonadaceae bacterium]|nr:bacteriocin [Pseudomonadaceae bacterium]